ncbi:MAG: Phenylalanine--tRNA ligase alpha subunit [Clostridia bacterium 41_269]|nr:MAG: Phenylalanine--tRNA ligase alpha subunit [Clostridia bacterium 41_269]
MLERLEQIRKTAETGLKNLQNMKDVENFRIKYLGKKGELTQVLRGLSQIPENERPAVGKLANEIRDYLEEQLQIIEKKIKKEEEEKKLKKEFIDVTLPGRRPVVGKKHPITRVLDEIKEIFIGLGFGIAEGPEVELDYYNFEALNLPPEHPARDMQDSFYITDKVLLRTHTSPVQIRVMEKMAPKLPIRIIAPGRVFRRDDDATHSPMFHQVEGLLIDRKVTFADLKGTLQAFVLQMFGESVRMRLRPSYFPFTEPSAEVDISCIICGGNGCRTCSHSGWLEILGSGLVHPKVLEMGGYNPEEVSGYAFGMGIERIAMLKYGIDDLRILFENDFRFLSQI